MKWVKQLRGGSYIVRGQEPGRSDLRGEDQHASVFEHGLSWVLVKARQAAMWIDKAIGWF